MDDPHFLRALCTLDVNILNKCGEHIVAVVLPLVSRCALCPYNENTDPDLYSWNTKRQDLVKLLLNYPEVNTLVEYLSTDFNEVASDCRDQLSLRKKQYQIDGSTNYSDAIPIEFDGYSTQLQFKVTLSEVMWLSSLISQKSVEAVNLAPILESSLHRDAIINLLCLALHELPDMLSIIEAVEVILWLPDAVDMFKRVVLNLPWSVDQVCESLILKTNDMESDQVKLNRIEAIKFLCRLSPTASALATRICTRTGKLSQVLIWINLGLDNKLTVDRIAKFLLTHKRVSKSLLQQRTVTGSSDSDLLTSIRNTLERELRELNEISPTEKSCSRISTVIKVYAFLRDSVAYKFNEVELENLLRLCSSLSLVSESDMTVTLQALCLVIASIHQMSTHSQVISAWFKSLSHSTHLYTRSYETSVGQFLLLMAIHYHSNQLSTISEMVASHLSIKPSVVKLSNTILKQIITFEVFTEQVISQLTALLSTTENLNANMTGHLPIHCVCQLLKSRAFSKHNISITHWVFNQLSSLSLPIHPAVIQMVQLYVSSTMPQQHNVRSANERLDEDKLQQVFRQPTSEANLASQLALLYYVLNHQEAVYTDNASLSRRRSAQPYSHSLVNSFPIKLLVTKAYQQRRQCSAIYSPIMKLMYNNMPHLCKASMWLPESRVHTRPNSLIQHFARSFSAADDKQPTPSIHKKYIQLLLATEGVESGVRSDAHLAVLMEGLKLIQTSPCDQIPRHMTSVFLRLWLAYSRISPETLYVATVNALVETKHGWRVTENQLVADPLLILRCLQDCRNPDIVSVLLHIIEVYTRASNRYYSLSAHLRTPHPTSTAPESHEICYSLLSAQESAVIQILLEQCLPKTNLGETQDEVLLSDRGERQALICSHIHKNIIEEPHLAKLISFQGYDRRVIPIAVAGIPSLHICLDYIPELLAQPDINKQAFGIRLTASMCEQYSIHKTFGMAKLCINTVITLLGVLPAHVIVSHILPVMSDIVNMCQRMPVLYEDWIFLLAKLIPMLAAMKGVVSSSKLKARAIALNSM